MSNQMMRIIVSIQQGQENRTKITLICGTGTFLRMDYLQTNTDSLTKITKRVRKGQTSDSLERLR